MNSSLRSLKIQQRNLVVLMERLEKRLEKTYALNMAEASAIRVRIQKVAGMLVDVNDRILDMELYCLRVSYPVFTKCGKAPAGRKTVRVYAQAA